MLDDTGGNQLSTQALQHIEAWMEKTLTESLRLETSLEEQRQQELLAKYNKENYRPLSAIEKVKVDRQSLSELGVPDRKQQDQIYRSFFVYCHGIHDFIRQFTRSSASSQYSSTSDLSVVLWGTFFKLFQFYDPSMRLLYQQTLQENANQSRKSFAENMKEKLAMHVTINEELLYDYKQIEIERSSLLYSSQLEVLSHESKQQQDAALIDHLQTEIQLLTRELQHLRNYKETTLKTIEVSKNALGALLARELSLTEQVGDLADRKTSLETELEDLRVKQRTLETENFRLKNFVTSQKQTIATIQEQLQRSQEKCYQLENQLRMTKESLQQAREQVTQYSLREVKTISFLQSNQELLSRQYRLFDYLTQSSTCWQQYHDWLLRYRDHEYRYYEQEDLDHASYADSLQHIMDLFSAMILYNSLQQSVSVASSHIPLPSEETLLSSSAAVMAANSAIMTDLLQHQFSQVQELSKSYQEIVTSNYHFTTSTTSSLLVLQDVFQDLYRSSQEITCYQQLQRRGIAAQSVGQVFVALSDQFVGQNGQLQKQIRNLQQINHLQERRISQLEEEKQVLQIFREKFEALEPLYLQETDENKKLAAEVKILQIRVSGLEAERLVLKEKESQFYGLKKTIAGHESDLKEREAYVRYLQEDFKKRFQEQEKQIATSAIYETLLPCCERSLQSLQTVLETYHSCRKQGRKVGNVGEGKESKDGLWQAMEQSDYRSVILRSKENLLFDDKILLSSAEKQRFIRILESLLALPQSLYDIILSTDVIHDMRQEMTECKVEVELIKTFSAKERRRLVSQYEGQLQHLKDLFTPVGSFSLPMQASEGMEGVTESNKSV